MKKERSAKNKKASKGRLVAILTVAALVIIVGVALAVILPRDKDDSAPPFTLTVSFGGSKKVELIPFKDESGGYHLFLPSGARATALSGKGVIDGTDIESFLPSDLTEGAHVYSAGKTESSLTVYRSTGVPAVFIDTESGGLDYIHADKQNRESGSLSATDGEKLSLEDEPLKWIKGRGNSSWKNVPDEASSKKSYNIRFEKKQSFLGLPEAKRWCLIANVVDPSYVRDSVAYDLAAKLGLEDSPLCKNVDLYINGEYRGDYLAVEAVEVGKNRIEITDLDKLNEIANEGVDLDSLEPVIDRYGERREGRIVDLPGARSYQSFPNDPDDITNGYVLEINFDTYNTTNGWFVSDRGLKISVKRPQNVSEAELEYISSLWQRAEDALYSDGGVNDGGESYTDLIDVRSMASIYLVYEFCKELDAGNQSCYLYKKDNEEKFVFGPIWDLDSGLANGELRVGDYFSLYDLSDPRQWLVNSRFTLGYDKDGLFSPDLTPFSAAFRHDDFRSLVKELWRTYRGVFEDEAEFVTSLYERIEPSAVMDCVRWDLCKSVSIPYIKSCRLAELGHITEHIKNETAAFDFGFSDESAFLFYHTNGGTGVGFCHTMLSIGDSAKLIYPNPDTITDFSKTSHLFGLSQFIWAKEGYEFVGWSLSPDGEGGVFEPGSMYRITSERTDLYAIWQKIE